MHGPINLRYRLFADLVTPAPCHCWVKLSALLPYWFSSKHSCVWISNFHRTDSCNKCNIGCSKLPILYAVLRSGTTTHTPCCVFNYRWTSWSLASWLVFLFPAWTGTFRVPKVTFPQRNVLGHSSTCHSTKRFSWKWLCRHSFWTFRNASLLNRVQISTVQSRLSLHSLKTFSNQFSNSSHTKVQVFLLTKVFIFNPFPHLTDKFLSLHEASTALLLVYTNEIPPSSYQPILSQMQWSWLSQRHWFSPSGLSSFVSKLVDCTSLPWQWFTSQLYCQSCSKAFSEFYFRTIFTAGV